MNFLSYNRKNKWLFSILLFLLLFSTNFSYGENTTVIKKAISLSEEKLINSSKAQRSIDEIDDKTQSLQIEYRSVLTQLKTYNNYNNQLNNLISSQRDELISLQNQINSIEDTKREIYPFLSRMVVALEKFVMLDIPFLKEERSNRISRLKNNLDRSDITLAEKLRQIFEAYRIELDYGRTIESYQSTINLNDINQTLRFLRVGRIGLFYISMDYSACGFWNQDDKKWQSLNDDFLYSIKQEIDIAEKKLPPDLLKLPFKVPVLSLNKTGAAQ